MTDEEIMAANDTISGLRTVIHQLSVENSSLRQSLREKNNTMINRLIDYLEDYRDLSK